jgi:hypothetical protein
MPTNVDSFIMAMAIGRLFVLGFRVLFDGFFPIHSNQDTTNFFPGIASSPLVS